MLGWSHRRRCKAGTCSFSPLMMEFNLWRAAKIFKLSLFDDHILLDYNPEIALLGARIRSIIKVAGQQECVDVSFVAEFSEFKRWGQVSGKRSDFLAGALKSSKTQKLWFFTKLMCKLIMSLSYKRQENVATCTNQPPPALCREGTGVSDCF